MLESVVVSKKNMYVRFTGDYDLLQDTKTISDTLSELQIYMKAPGDYKKILDTVVKAYQIRSVTHVIVDYMGVNVIDEINIEGIEGVRINTIYINSTIPYNINKITGNFSGRLIILVREYMSLEGTFKYVETAVPLNFIKINSDTLKIQYTTHEHIKLTESNIKELHLYHYHTGAEGRQCEVLFEKCKLGKSTENYYSISDVRRTEIECDIESTHITLDRCNKAFIEFDNNNHNVWINEYHASLITLNGKTPYKITSLNTNYDDDKCVVIYDSNCIFMDKSSNFKFHCTSKDNSNVALDGAIDDEYIKKIDFLISCEQKIQIEDIIRLKPIVTSSRLNKYIGYMELVRDSNLCRDTDAALRHFKRALRMIIDNKLTEVADYFRTKYIYIMACIEGDYKIDKELTELLVQLNFPTPNIFSFNSISKTDEDKLRYILKLFSNKYQNSYYKVEEATTLSQLEYIIDVIPQYDKLAELLDLFNVSNNLREQYAFKHLSARGLHMMKKSKTKTVKLIETMYTEGAKVEISGLYINMGVELQSLMKKYKLEDKYVIITLASTQYPQSQLIEHFLNNNLYLSDIFNNYVNKEKVVNNLNAMPAVREYLDKLNNASIYKIFNIEPQSKLHNYNSIIINTLLMTEYVKLKDNKLYNGKQRNIDTIYLDSVNEMKSPYNKQSNEYKLLKHIEEKMQKDGMCGEELKMMDSYIMEHSDHQFVYKNDVINSFITKHNNILKSSPDNPIKIPKAYTTEIYNPNLIYLKLLPRTSKIEWDFARRYMKENKLPCISPEELTIKYFNHMKDTMPAVAASTKAAPLLTNLTNLFCEEVNVILSQQSIESKQRVYRLNLKEVSEITSIENNELYGNVMRYINQSNHPVSRKYLTVGWVRFNINDEAKSIWINEIQTDMSKILGLYDEGLKNLFTNKISYNLVMSFQYWIAKHYPSYTVVLPSYTTRKKLLSGDPTPNGYDNPARKLKFIKFRYEDTIWTKVKPGNGLVWVWTSPK